MLVRVILFLVLNFGALAIGSIFTGKGVPSEWYQSLAKAPWNPPGWMFGTAWTTIMICFAVYMTFVWKQVENQKLLAGLYLLQIILNVSWNPVFFHLRNPGMALVVITGLTILMGIILFFYWSKLSYFSVLVLPYVIWLAIATSLNAYIVFNN